MGIDSSCIYGVTDTFYFVTYCYTTKKENIPRLAVVAKLFQTAKSFIELVQLLQVYFVHCHSGSLDISHGLELVFKHHLENSWIY